MAGQDQGWQLQNDRNGEHSILLEASIQHPWKSGKTKNGNALPRTTLITCAHAAVKNKMSYFHGQFMKISAPRGNKCAYVAAIHLMLIAIYHILKDGVVFKDLGADYYIQFNKERKINAYLEKLKALGWEAPAVAA